VVRENPRFRLYFCGSVISDLGTWLQNTAQVLLAYQIAHHSVLMVGLVTCAQFSSPLVLGPFAAVLADKFGGRQTLLGTQIVAGLVAGALGGLELEGRLTVWWLGAGALLSGLCFTFALPARNVTVRRLVSGENEVRPAYAMDAVSYNLGRAVAPLMSIVLVHWVGFAWSFIGNAVSFAVFTAVLWGVGRSGSAEPERKSRVMDGFRVAASDARIMISCSWWPRSPSPTILFSCSAPPSPPVCTCPPTGRGGSSLLSARAAYWDRCAAPRIYRRCAWPP
jgi:MFS family permease